MKKFGLKMMDIYELRALNRLVMEAKFSECIIDSAIIGSPVTAKIANDILDQLVVAEKELDPALSGMLEQWRKYDLARREWGVVLKHIDLDIWDEWDEDMKKSSILNLMSPFIISDELLNNWLLEVDTLVESRRTRRVD